MLKVFKKQGAHALALLSIVLCLVMVRLELIQVAEQLRKEFQAQNRSELHSGDVFSLATRLNSLSSAINWICIEGTREGQVFFSRGSSGCAHRPWNETVLITNPASDLKISITLRLPATHEFAMSLFIVLQAILLVVLIWSTRRTERERAEQTANRLRLEAEVGRLAEQVAHDIRSPLAALDHLSSHLKDLPEETRVMLRSAVTRIKDIAQGLLDSNRVHSTSTAPEKSTSNELLSDLLDSVVTEKRVQLRSRIDVSIEFEPDSAGYGLFVKVNTIEFKRVISNILNNSIDAIDKIGRVLITLSSRDSSVEIVIQDNGKGIPPKVLAQLGVRGFSSGKERGNGLGVAHAKATLEQWGGSITFESLLGRGTQIKILLPRSPAPQWFVSKLILAKVMEVIVIDDDISIHHVWDQRFLKFHESLFSLRHYSSLAQCLEELPSVHHDSQDVLYLVDYEFLGETKTGIDLIRELGIAAQSILVTSRLNEESLRIQLNDLGLRAIPKGLASIVPMSSGNESTVKIKPVFQQPDAVLLDDDELIHQIWKLGAQQFGASLKTYKTDREFFQELDSYDKKTPFYVDSNLGAGVRGEDIAKQLFDQGFYEVFLATGYPSEKFAGLPGIKKVVGKESPWVPVLKERRAT